MRLWDAIMGCDYGMRLWDAIMGCKDLRVTGYMRFVTGKRLLIT